MFSKIKNMKKLIWVFFSLGVFLGAAIFILLWIVRFTDTDMRANLLNETRIIARAIDIDHITGLSATASDITSPDYLRLKKQLAHIRASNNKIRFVYLMGRGNDGEIFFYLDSEPIGAKDESSPGQIFSESSPKLKSVFLTRQEAVEGPSTDRWGTWVSAYVPLVNYGAGRSTLVLGMDVDARYWKKEIAFRCALPASLILLIFLGSVLLFILEHFNQVAFLSKRRSQAILDNVSDIIMVHDSKGKFIEVNQEACKKLGYSRAELLKLNVSDIDPEAISKGADKFWLKVIGGGKVNFVSNQRRKDGSTYPVEISLSQMNLGRDILVLGVIRDISERKKVEHMLEEARSTLELQNKALDLQLRKTEKSHEIVISMLDDNNQIRARLEKSLTELKQVQRMLIQSEKLEAIGRLASGIAHEVKNPLAIILAGVNYFEMSIPLEEKNLRGTLEIIKNSIARVDKIMRALTDFSRVDEFKMQLEDINVLIEDSLSLVGYTGTLKNIKIVKEYQDGLPKILADKIKIEQVFVILLNNAIQAMPKGGTITLRTYSAQVDKLASKTGKRQEDFFGLGEKIIVAEVEDTGEGISGENFEKIFEPFFTTKEPGRGTGLGLSIARSIVEMHMALIKIDSQINKGTKVTLQFKISKTN